MDYKKPLIDGHFIKRYKRFFADVRLDGKVVVAHVPNTGSLKSVCDNGEGPCRLFAHNDPKRKLQFTLEQVKTKTSWVGVNTHVTNEIAWEGFTKKLLPHWAKYSDGQREVKISAETRLDMKLTTAKGKAHFVEVKNVTLAREKTALFPDCETTRGQKHLRELMILIDEGHTAEILFVVQRTDCHEFSPADDLDPEYGKLLRQAKKAGVIVSAYPVRLTGDRAELDGKNPLRLLI